MEKTPVTHFKAWGGVLIDILRGGGSKASIDSLGASIFSSIKPGQVTEPSQVILDVKR